MLVVLLVNIVFPTLPGAQAGIATLGLGGFTCTAAFIGDALKWTVQVESDIHGTMNDAENTEFATGLGAALDQTTGVVSDQPPSHRVGWLPQALHDHQPPRFDAG